MNSSNTNTSSNYGNNSYQQNNTNNSSNNNESASSNFQNQKKALENKFQPLSSQYYGTASKPTSTATSQSDYNNQGNKKLAPVPPPRNDLRDENSSKQSSPSSHSHSTTHFSPFSSWSSSPISTYTNKNSSGSLCKVNSYTSLTKFDLNLNSEPSNKYQATKPSVKIVNNYLHSNHTVIASNTTTTNNNNNHKNILNIAYNHNNWKYSNSNFNWKSNFLLFFFKTILGLFSTNQLKLLIFGLFFWEGHNTCY